MVDQNLIAEGRISALDKLAYSARQEFKAEIEALLEGPRPRMEKYQGP